MGQLLWLTGVFILLFSPMPNHKETQQTGDEEDTRAEPTLTVSIEFDPSPAGTQAGRRRETDELGTLECHQGKGSGQQNSQWSLKEMEAGSLPPEDIHPQIPSQYWDESRGRL